MLKKSIHCLCILVFVVSLVGTMLCVVKNIKVINWYKTTLTVTFIGTPDGTVFGNYIDSKGQQHLNESAFYKSSFSGYKKNVEQYYGNVITIMVNPETGEIINYDDLLKNNTVFLGLAILFGILLFINKNRQKQAKTYEE